MIQAKEKAKKLLYSFLDIEYDSDEMFNAWIDFYLAKECALISIDNEIETIESLIKLCNSDNFMKINLEDKLQELKEVKTEIKKL